MTSGPDHLVEFALRAPGDVGGWWILLAAVVAFAIGWCLGVRAERAHPWKFRVPITIRHGWPPCIADVRAEIAGEAPQEQLDAAAYVARLSKNERVAWREAVRQVAAGAPEPGNELDEYIAGLDAEVLAELERALTGTP